MFEPRSTVEYLFTFYQLVPPKIAHFDFGDEPSNFADSASVQCLVTSGDLPIEFRWFINDRPVSEFYGITMAKMGKRNSVLTIDSVNGKHAGNYTCLASNTASIANYTSQLIVNGTLYTSSFDLYPYNYLYYSICRYFHCLFY